MRFASLGSGSKGNGTLIDDGKTCILIDLGFTLKETERRLRRLGKTPEDVHAVLVTHEHADHIHGVAPFARKYNQPVYLTPGTFNHKKMGVLPRLHKVNCHRPFRIGSLGIEPVPVPHDAREPCQYLISSNGLKIGMLTDLGHISPYVEQQYAMCHALLLECNHDVEMLSNGPYPYQLKQRVNGDHGHLNNEQAAGLLAKMELEKLQHLVISHLSEKNNKPKLAEQAVSRVLSGWRGTLHIADQEAGFDWIELVPH
ncbi:MAG TPA: MBL fold metallo-hydrolase [Gammaproteobacteria bacterium]|nr:MBL fold metallo-hydrolase [Gammaproteobacteria bacterium]HIL98306.1 MBL fold metallo-hydrolase [Pseudomonadales bacterium]